VVVDGDGARVVLDVGVEVVEVEVDVDVDVDVGDGRVVVVPLTSTTGREASRVGVCTEVLAVATIE